MGKFFVRSVILGVENAIKQIMTIGNVAKILCLFMNISENPIISVKNVGDELTFSFNTVLIAVEMMMHFRILQQTNNQSRYRFFEYKDSEKVSSPFNRKRKEKERIYL